MGRFNKHLFAFATTMFCLSGQAFAASFIEQPTVIQNPNEKAPLVAILKFKADEPVKTEVQIDNGDKKWSLHFDEAKDPTKGLIIAGMHANKEHTFDIFITGKDGKKVKAKQSYDYKTPALPAIGYEFPTIKMVKVNQLHLTHLI